MRGPCQRAACGQLCDHVCLQTAVCVRLMMLADDCRGCAGVHMSEWCVHEVREVQAACVVTSQGRPRRRRERRRWRWSVVAVRRRAELRVRALLT
jgi:hypothetical protein